MNARCSVLLLTALLALIGVHPVAAQLTNAAPPAPTAAALRAQAVQILDHSQPQAALPLLQQAYQQDKTARDADGQARDLADTGNAYHDLSRPADALAYYQKALPLFVRAGDADGQANDLLATGNAYRDLSRPADALAYYQQALPLFVRAGDADGQASDLLDTGNAYDDLSRPADALAEFQQALPLYVRAGDVSGAAKTLNNLMAMYQNQGQPRLAIFYGKQSVNAYQTVRAGLTTLDQKTQQTYLLSIAHTYRTLADLLISQGRLPEAQQVLRLLKQQEFYDFQHAQGGGQGQEQTPALPPIPVAFTPHEQRWLDAYNKAAAPLTALGPQEQDLAHLKAPTPAQAAQLAQVRKQLTDAQGQVADVQTRMAADFQQPPTADDTLPDTAQAQDVRDALAHTPGAAALYTIVSPDHLYLILVTAGVPPRVYTPDHLYDGGKPVPYTADALYHQVAALRDALTDPGADPRPRLADLYRVLIAPLKSDLQAAHVHTLLFSLDDALRYVPPAALYDPDHGRYLCQDYAAALITLAASPPADTQDNATRPPSVLAAGVVQGYSALDPATKEMLTFPDLPGVHRELTEIVRQGQETDGLFPGEHLEDAQFTQGALEGALATGAYPMVHLASHFALHATAQDSYLLLGGGALMPVSDLEALNEPFRGVDLLALSACDTDVEVADTKAGTAGREVEGFGALAQSLGARSVLASLWPVSDQVTPDLMGAFYGYLRAHPGCALPDALRWAQLSLLYGHAPGPADGFPADPPPAPPTASPDTPAAPAPAGVRRGIALVNAPPGAADAPPYTPPAGAQDAHPYFWAPFVLIGNWR